MDVREMVYAMKELNKIDDSGALVPGTVLKVPVKKNDSPVRAWTMWLKTKYIGPLIQEKEQCVEWKHL